MNIKNIVNQNNTTIIDVREPSEFASGHAKGAINIPLGLLVKRKVDSKDLTTPIVVYCRSGMRSGQALSYLQALGIKEVYNGVSLEEVLSMQR